MHKSYNIDNILRNASLLDKLLGANGKDFNSRDAERWVCLHVHTGKEHHTAVFLQRKSSAFFFPLLLEGDTIEPLFSGYVFCRVSASTGQEAREKDFVLRVLVPGDEGSFLSHIQAFSLLNAFVKEEEVITVGSRIKMAQGPLSGLFATVREEPRKSKVKIVFGEHVIEINKDQVLVVNESSKNWRLVSIAEPLIPENEIRRIIDIESAAINEELIKYLSHDSHSMYDLSPRRFEELIAELLSDMGYETHLTPTTRDGGRDILAVIKVPPNRQMLTLVECKKYRPPNKVGVEIVESITSSRIIVNYCYPVGC